MIARSETVVTSQCLRKHGRLHPMMFTQPSLQSQRDHRRRGLRHRIASGAIAATVLAAGALVAATLTTPADASPSPNGPGSTSEFRGVNWADPRDNYASDEVVPSGLSTADSYATTYRKSQAIVSE